MGRLKTGVPSLFLSLLVLACASCGGGSSSIVQPPPPPPPSPDFSLSLSSNSVTVSQGSTSSAINVSVNAQNGFSGPVQVSLTGLPAGVISNPASPFTVLAGASAPIVIGASSNAQAGNYNLSAQANSGALSHSASLTLAVQSAMVSTLPRTTFVRTDSVSPLDDPFGQPFHRHLSSCFSTPRFRNSASTTQPPYMAPFSRDTHSLYVSESLSGAPVITILSAQDAHLIGRVPDTAIQGISSEIEDSDETQLVFGLSNRGASFIDAATPVTLTVSAPAFASTPLAQPAEGPLAGGTPVEISGQNFTGTPQIKFGTQLVSNATALGTTQLQANSPPSVASGPVNISAFFSNSWLALAPDAFS